ncbi:MAG TPA: glycosyltransferase family 39 protein, partial [Clostridia bacterium]|nr:glycosyltransferase family 39 protein [Clostridia bacterium]
MHWLQALDTQLFRFINLNLANPVFDQVMPWISGNGFFYPALVVLGFLLVWKGGLRGLVCLLMLILIVSLGDGVVLRTIKEAVGRPRPFLEIGDARCLLGKGGSGSFPSAHAGNWFAATVIAFIYFRKSWRFLLPAALVVSFSRVYNGVHYPGDVLAGAALGAGYGAAGVWTLDALWRWTGRRWFPLWWNKLPSLLNPPASLAYPEEAEEQAVPPRNTRYSEPVPQANLDQHWLRLGYIVIACLLVARWFYVGSDTIQLSEDEAYQWVWSKYLDWSYYSKPPMIAYTQFVGTTLWGDTQFGVRFFSPLIAAILSLMLLRFFARDVNARAGFFLLLMLTATPLMAAGSVLMTVDPLSVLFWTAAMLAGWRAALPNGTLADWAKVGLWMGLGFLSKYTALFQWLCWAVFFLLWPPARKHLRRPGPYAALLINALCAIPVLIWNAQREWITVTHVAQGAGAGRTWEPTLKFLFEFIGAELGLLNPVFFIAMIWACIAMWRRQRHNPRLLFLFSMGAPVFLVYLMQSFRGRVFPNWIAPAVVPLACLTVIYWDTRLRLGQLKVKTWLSIGLAVGLPLVLLAHDTNLIGKIT